MWKKQRYWVWIRIKVEREKVLLGDIVSDGAEMLYNGNKNIITNVRINDYAKNRQVAGSIPDCVIGIF